MTDFSTFNVDARVARAIAEAGYSAATPIQAQAIPHVMAGRDLLGVAQTGTGKTAAFAVPTLHRLAANPGPRAPKSTRVLTLAPTRELAIQIAKAYTTYAHHLPLRIATVFGGVKIGPQMRTLKDGVDVLVATPGRLIDLIDQKALTLSRVDTLILDEADQMLDLGFIHALRRIVPLTPSSRQTLLFSATMPKAIAGLARDYLRDPVQVSVTPPATTAERVDQTAIFVTQAHKPALLAHTLRAEGVELALVFTRTKHGADRVVRKLASQGLEARAIHGNKSQSQRQRALEAFRTGACRILVATDIAARGIDIPGVSHVINFDLPNVPEQYVHRIGRTARAGRAGQAVAFVNEEERSLLRDIEKATRQKTPIAPLPDALAHAAPAEPAARPQPAQKGGSGGKPSGRPGGGPAKADGGKPRRPRRNRSRKRKVEAA